MVLDEIEHGKIIISNYKPDYRNFSNTVSRIKNEIVWGYDFIMNFNHNHREKPSVKEWK